jgi:nicotinamidase/pyrazinamidase
LKKALVLVDLQNDFIPGGSLAVRDGDAVIPIANAVQKKKWDLIVATQDWHPQNHGSFASNHPGKHPGDVIDLGGLQQVLWPDHCVQGSRGARFHAVLDRTRVHKVFKKGTDPAIDSYSTFFDNAHRKSTGLGEYLKEQKVTDVYLLGLATDYCVKYSALDAVHLGFKTHVIIDGCRGVELKAGDTKKAVEELKKAGVEIVTSDDL